MEKVYFKFANQVVPIQGTKGVTVSIKGNQGIAISEAEYKKEVTAYEAERAKQLADEDKIVASEIEKAEANKASAMKKLTELGLTEDEVKSL